MIPVVSMFIIGCSKPRASFYLRATGPSLLRISEDSEEAKMQMEASPYWSLTLLTMRYWRAVWPEWVWSIFVWTFSVIHVEVNKNRALPLPCYVTSRMYLDFFGPQFPHLLKGWGERLGRALWAVMICYLNPADSVRGCLSLEVPHTHCLGQWPPKCHGDGHSTGQT